MPWSQISIPIEDQRRARARALDLGISLEEYVRRLIRADLGEGPRTAEVSALFDLGDSGGSDIARHKDGYLADAFDANANG